MSRKSSRVCNIACNENICLENVNGKCEWYPKIERLGEVFVDDRI